MATSKDKIRQLLSQGQESEDSTPEATDTQPRPDDRPRRDKPSSPNQELARRLSTRSTNAIEGFARGNASVTANLVGGLFDLGGFVADQTGMVELENQIRRSVGAVPVSADDPMFGSEQVKRVFDRIGIKSDRDIDVNELPESARVAFRAGEAFTGGVLFAPIPFAWARTGQSTLRALRPTASELSSGTVAASRAGGPITQTIRTQPGRAASTEVAASAGAAQGAGIAEAAAPNSPGARLAGELTGSVINPMGTIFRATGFASRHLRTAVNSMRQAGREQRGVEIIQDVLQATGENPRQLAYQLERVSGTRLAEALTPGQLVQSEGLVAMEKALARNNPSFSGERAQAYTEGMSALRKAIDNLIAIGDPTALSVAARLRQNHFNDTVNGLLNNAERQAAEALSGVSQTSAGARAAASDRAQGIMSDALKLARDAERSLYDKIPKNLKLQRDSVENFTSAVVGVRGELTKGESLPAGEAVKDVLKRARNGKASVGDLIKLRTRFREKGRELTANNKFREARQVSQLADGIEDDIAALGIPESDAAREFSIILNDKFSRSFAGRTLERERTGALRIAPEEALARAFSGSGERAARQFEELESAARFADEEVAETLEITPKMFAGAVRNEQEAFLRDAASQFVRDGRVDPQALARFVDNNDRLLARFPGLRQELQSAESAERLLRNVERSTRKARKIIEQQSAFARLAQVEAPAPYVGSIIKGESPKGSFKRLSNMAKKSGNGSVEGLKTSVLDFARMKATTAEGGFSFRRMKNELMGAQGEGRPSAMRLMRDNEVMSAEEARNWRTLLDEAIRIEDAMANPNQLNQLVDEPSFMFDLAVRMVGANIGGAAAQGSSAGTPIVLAGATSRAFRRLLELTPMTRTLDVLIEVSRPGNSKAMAAMLKRVKTESEAERVMSRVAKFLVDNRLVPAKTAGFLREKFIGKSRGPVDSFNTADTPAVAATVAPDAGEEENR